MLGMGILSLLSLGLIGMAAGGGDDVDIDETKTDPDVSNDVTPGETIDLFGATEEAGSQYDPTVRNELILTYVPIEAVDEGTGALITDYLDALPTDQPIDQAAAEFRAFVTDLGVGIIDNTIDEEAQAPVVEVQEEEEREETEYDDRTRTNLILTYVPIGAVDAETSALIEEYLANIPVGQPIVEAAADFRAYVTDLGVEVPSNSNADGVGPAVGEGFRDPLILAEELEAERIQAEIEAAIARQPENLVTVTDAEGAEVDDGLVLAERSADADESDPLFTVTAPEDENDISVGYDAEHTFLVEYNDATKSIEAGLNTVIEGPEGQPFLSRTTIQDEEGNLITEESFKLSFNGSTDIAINVTPEQIGVQTSQISLTNPSDSLTFNLSDEVDGNLHLVFREEEIDQEGQATTVLRAYVILTGTDQADLSASAFNALLSGQSESGDILAEIYLGEEWVAIDETTSETQLYDYANDAAKISANVDFASEQTFDDSDLVAGEGTGSDPGTTDDPFGGFGGIDLPGLDPVFFFP